MCYGRDGGYNKKTQKQEFKTTITKKLDKE